ncbi:DUF4133 domain-containing protein [Niabella sp.]|uniref:DUF4133 domain-containing protein n=1 Tax=Niabella sp. TaxID=1962976 RepID=UPI002637A309|nr:DUF4133 domain-containing protein [Niabella sp.]
MASIYEINKGINRPIEFKGFRAQYVTYLAICLVLLLLLFAIGYLIGAYPYILVAVIAGGGFVLVSWIYKMSHKYGEHGLMKASAYRSIPTAIVCRSRKVLLCLKQKGGSK